MNYNETVEKVMMLLKEKEVCSSSQKSHRDCYESLGLFIKQRDGNYSEAIRESWLAEIKNELPRQRYTVWAPWGKRPSSRRQAEAGSAPAEPQISVS